MAQKDMNPAARAGADRARKSDRAGVLIISEDIALALNLQAFRAAHIARHHRLSPIAARVVADLCFREARR